MIKTNENENQEITKFETNYGKINVKDNFNDYHLNYYHTNKKFITCPCGCSVNRYKINVHKKTKKHQRLLEAKENNTLPNIVYFNVN
jgi:hypothetical protein